MILSGGKLGPIDCIKVNIDYESVLFRGKPSPVANHALEFLAFYLQDLPVLTDLTYDAAFCERIERISGRKVRTVKKGNAANWWGPLADPEHEKWLNSKITSTELAIAEGWTDAKIISKSEVKSLQLSRSMIVKDPFGMSGKGVINLSPMKDNHLPAFLPDQLIVESKHNRRFDFSHFVFPDGETIAYENIVDERFQYRGTIIDTTLSFSPLISKAEWDKFNRALDRIREFYGEVQPFGYSVDSFVYEEGGELKIFPLCEINARRTMGFLAYEFAKLLGNGRKCALSLKQPIFTQSIKLSPDGAFFDVFFSHEE